MGLILSAVALYILVSIFSPGTASAARLKILAIGLGALVVQATVIHWLPNLVGLAAALLLSLIFVVVALIFWCGVERKPALKVAVSYLVIAASLMLLTAFLQYRR